LMTKLHKEPANKFARTSYEDTHNSPRDKSLGSSHESKMLASTV